MSVQFSKQECEICLEVQFGLKRLSCNHSMCNICFEKLNNCDDGTLTCPFCRKMVKTKNSSNVQTEVSHKVQCSTCDQYHDGSNMWICDGCLIFVCSKCQLKFKVHNGNGCHCSEYDVGSLKRMCACYIQLVYSPFITQHPAENKRDLQYAIHLSLAKEFDAIVTCLGKLDVPDMSWKSETLMREPEKMVSLTKLCLQFVNYGEQRNIQLSHMMEQLLLQKFHSVVRECTNSVSVETQTIEVSNPKPSSRSRSKAYRRSAVTDHKADTELTMRVPSWSTFKLLETWQFFIVFDESGKTNTYCLLRKSNNHTTEGSFDNNFVLCDAQCCDYYNDTVTVLVRDWKTQILVFLQACQLDKVVNGVSICTSATKSPSFSPANHGDKAILSRSCNCAIEIPKQDGLLQCYLLRTKSKYTLEERNLSRTARVFALDESKDSSREIVVFGLNRQLQYSELMKSHRTTLFKHTGNDVEFDKMCVVFQYPMVYAIDINGDQKLLRMFYVGPDGVAMHDVKIAIHSIPLYAGIHILTEPHAQVRLITISEFDVLGNILKLTKVANFNCVLTML